jgi:hypothetical protein
MLDIVLCMLALLAGGLVLELFAAARAPRGYQDENGFHLGLPAQQGPDASVLSAATVKPLRTRAVTPVNASLQPVTTA